MLKQEMTSDGWRITADAPNDEAYAALKGDRIVNCFALADLLPPFRQHTRFALAFHAQTGQQASLLILEHPQVHILSPAGDVRGVAALLARVDLPASTVIQTTPEHWWPLAPYYSLPNQWRALQRMSLSVQTFQRPDRSALPVAERMTKDDLSELIALYKLFPNGHFRPDLIEEELFYGVRVAQRLVAAGGTHVLALPYGLAVLGNIFTHPDRRGRGYAQAVVSALVTDLLAQGCQDIILNVDGDNAPAIHVYTKLGFQPHCQIVSGPAKRR